MTKVNIPSTDYIMEKLDYEIDSDITYTETGALFTVIKSEHMERLVLDIRRIIKEAMDESDKPINIYSPNDMRGFRDMLLSVMEQAKNDPQVGLDESERRAFTIVRRVTNWLIVEAERKE